jgi:uncharacterized protein YndB with AHSA1/START domain
MPKVHVSTVINAPIERVWRTVGDFNGLTAWMPGMKDGMIEEGNPANAIGAVRRLSMAGTSDKLRERLEELSPQDYRITYSVLEGPLPVKKIVTTMQLRPITDSYGTLGEWSSQFETEPGGEEEGAQFMCPHLRRRLPRIETTSRRLIANAIPKNGKRCSEQIMRR